MDCFLKPHQSYKCNSSFLNDTNIFSTTRYMIWAIYPQNTLINLTIYSTFRLSNSNIIYMGFSWATPFFELENFKYNRKLLMGTLPKFFSGRYTFNTHFQHLNFQPHLHLSIRRPADQL